jgi:restriction system protein
MPIPDYQKLMLPVLRFLSDGLGHPIAEIGERIAEQLKLTGEDLAAKQSSGYQTLFANRVAWAVQYLKSAMVIQAVSRGVYKLTERGVSILKTNPSKITLKTLRQFLEFVQFEGKTEEPGQTPAPATPQVETKATPEETLAESFQVLREALAHDLLDAITNGTPAAFERIVVDLLVSMGYGGSVEDAGKVVGKSGDGGIDWIIKQDKLGLDAIHVQAKRWKDVVGSPEIIKFSGGPDEATCQPGSFHHHLDVHEGCTRIRGGDATEDCSDRRETAFLLNDRTRCRRIIHEVVHAEAVGSGLF